MYIHILLYRYTIQTPALWCKVFCSCGADDVSRTYEAKIPANQKWGSCSSQLSFH